MATVAKSSKELVWGPSVLLVAEEGSEPSEQLGFTREPIEVSGTRNVEDDMVQERTGAVNSKTLEQGVTISGTLGQIMVETIERVFGATADGGIVDYGGEPEENLVALRIVSSTKSRRPIHLLALEAKSVGEWALAFGKADPSGLPFEFRCYESSDRLLRMIFGSDRSDQTLSTGALTRVQSSPGKYITHHRVVSESTGSADTLDSITAGDLVDGELIRLQLANLDEPITLTHLTDTLELVGDEDFVLEKRSQWIDLRYDLANTKWIEVARYEAK